MAIADVDVAPKLNGMNYRVLKSLGSGAGSTILQISDNESGSKYALKVVKRQSSDDDIYLDQAKHEFQVTRRLSHESIVKIHDCVVRKSWLKTTGIDLLMEYVDGRTLDNYRDELDQEFEDRSPESRSRRKLRRLIAVFNNIAAAMAHMHRRGVYHGDLKPSNIMAVRGTGVKIIDFGTAWLYGQAKDRVQGTPQYMAPEQVGEKVVNELTDIYNMGATMYRLLTGEFANLDLPRMDSPRAYRNRRRPTEFDSEIPKALEKLVLQCMEHDSRRRPEKMLEVQERLHEIAAQVGIRPST